jgi:hypothetical protein
VDILKLNYNLNISPCALRFAERINDKDWRIGNVESIEIYNELDTKPIDPLSVAVNPLDFDLLKENCFTILAEHGALKCMVNSDPMKKPVNLNAAKQWMRTNEDTTLDMSSEALQALKLRTVEIEAFKIEMQRVYLTARRLDLTCRQYLALQAAQIADCKYFSIGGGKWSVILSEKARVYSNAVAYQMELQDMLRLTELGYLRRNGRYVFDIVRYPELGSLELLTRAFYLQQN